MPGDLLRVANWIGGREVAPAIDAWLDKTNPHDDTLLCHCADSSANDVQSAVAAAAAAFPQWSEQTPVARGRRLAEIAAAMKASSAELAECVAIETGKPPEDAAGEVQGAISQADYFAGEGMRLYARSLTSGVVGKFTHSVRQPRGVCGLIVPANTPIANIAWKVFPALICGNTVVLKASEEAPSIAQLFAKLAQDSGLPDGVMNVVQGRGRPAGAALVEDPRVSVISFTGSTGVGRWIAEVGGRRLARVSLELGGKNPFVVCDDADLEHAVRWAALSAFSNAGQRCAAGSRVLVFARVYEAFKERFVAKARSLKLGTAAGCDLGPVITRPKQQSILAAIDAAKAKGAEVLCGGVAPSATHLAHGYYVQPTIVETLTSGAEIDKTELFGPVCTLHRVEDLHDALRLANHTNYGLTAAIHTRDVDRAVYFTQRVRAGVVNVNLGTFGSEPHMPFGGFGDSGNGTREPGVEALDVYSELKNISMFTRDEKL